MLNGGLMVRTVASVTISNSMFLRNIQDNYSALCLYTSFSVNVISTEFIENITNKQGGAIMSFIGGLSL